MKKPKKNKVDISKKSIKDLKQYTFLYNNSLRMPPDAKSLPIIIN